MVESQDYILNTPYIILVPLRTVAIITITSNSQVCFKIVHNYATNQTVQSFELPVIAAEKIYILTILFSTAT